MKLREHLDIEGPYPGCVESSTCAVDDPLDKARLVRVIVEEVVKLLGENKHALD
jgi:hypothetical protein